MTHLEEADTRVSLENFVWGGVGEQDVHTHRQHTSNLGEEINLVCY